MRRTAWSGSAKGDSKPGTGHYYLKDSFSISSQKIAMGTVCIDLNGNTLESVGRALLSSGKQCENPIINVMDSKGGGYVKCLNTAIEDFCLLHKNAADSPDPEILHWRKREAQMH